MATSPDAKVIDRESSKKGIVSRYLDKEKAGGAFSAYKAGTNTMIQGVQTPYGYTYKSVLWTIEPGFTVGGPPNFNQKALNYADALKVNTVKYTSNSFAR
jgi:hypothetical protein